MCYSKASSLYQFSHITFYPGLCVNLPTIKYTSNNFLFACGRTIPYFFIPGVDVRIEYLQGVKLNLTKHLLETC